MEKKIRNLLIGFFAVMLVFTIISRAAASAMVTKVQVDTVAGGRLVYEAYGTGIIKADAGKYIELMDGYKIGEVPVQTGKPVKEGDLLFCYDKGSLEEKKSELEDALDKLELQYDKIGLAGGSADTAEEEEKASEMAIEMAKEDIAAAKINYADKIRAVKKDKEEEYKKAVEEWEEIALSGQEELKKADRAVTDAETELSQLVEPEVSLNEVINNYRLAVVMKDEEHQIPDAFLAVILFYYGDSYEEHNNEVSDAKKILDRAQEDLEGVRRKWDNIRISEWDRYGSIEVQNAYYEKVKNRQDEISSAERQVQDAQEKYNELTEADNKLKAAMDNYRTAIEASADVNASYQDLYLLLSEGRVAKKTTLTEAETKLSRAKEDREEVLNSWNRKLQAAEETKEQLYKAYVSLEDGSYDYTEDLKEENKAVDEAQRAYDRAALQLEQLKLEKQSAQEGRRSQEESDDIERNILKIDIDSHKEELDRLNKIISENGEIHAPVDGVIAENDLSQGVTLSGQEKLIIVTGGYELAMTADKEDMKYFAAGDEIKIEIPSGDKKISSQIENIELPDQDGKVAFTALLPVGEYQTGASLDYELTKESDSYSMCIPIQALRQDGSGTYILLAKEKDSVLGKVKEAFRISVSVLSKDGKNAAIEGSISDEDEIIVGSNRNFSEGDRVRIYEME